MTRTEQPASLVDVELSAEIIAKLRQEVAYVSSSISPSFRSPVGCAAAVPPRACVPYRGTRHRSAYEYRIRTPSDVGLFVTKRLGT
eukprot:scaffold509853_cov48-Prasinocladus_malaysianus.AAC.1